MLRFALACVLLLTANAVRARDIFVDNQDGDDRNRGESAAVGETGVNGPVRTIAKALRIAAAGDRIVLKNTSEPYHETISLSAAQHCGLPGQRFTIDGQGAILDGSAPVPSDAWEIHEGHTFRFRPARKAHQQLFIAGLPAARKKAERNDPKPPALAPLEWCLHRGQIYFCVEKGKLPSDYALTHCVLRTGLTLYHVHDVHVQNLTVQGFQLDGINAHDGVRDCTLANVVLRGNGRSGLSIGGCSRVYLGDSTVGDNGEAQVRAEGISLALVEKCDLLPATAPAVVQKGGRVLLDGQKVQP